MPLSALVKKNISRMMMFIASAPSVQSTGNSIGAAQAQTMSLPLIAGSGSVQMKKTQKPEDWEAKVKGLLKAELKRRDITYQELAEKLAAAGIAETPENIANKISRGKFSAVFLVQCLEVIGCQTVRLVD